VRLRGESADHVEDIQFLLYTFLVRKGITISTYCSILFSVHKETSTRSHIRNKRYRTESCMSCSCPCPFSSPFYILTQHRHGH
jgi:hypothetical protein